MFAALSDPIRLRILDTITDDQQCVCEIHERVSGIAPNLLSYHLKVLKGAGLIESSRRGRWVDYRLTPNAGRMVTTALPVGLTEVAAR